MYRASTLTFSKIFPIDMANLSFIKLDRYSISILLINAKGGGVGDAESLIKCVDFLIHK